MFYHLRTNKPIQPLRKTWNRNGKPIGSVVVLRLLDLLRLRPRTPLPPRFRPRWNLALPNLGSTSGRDVLPHVLNEPLTRPSSHSGCEPSQGLLGTHLFRPFRALHPLKRP